MKLAPLIYAVSLGGFFAMGSLTMAHDAWPQFRGPGGQGHGAAGALPMPWDETRDVVWRTAVPGKGWSSPLVLENQVWLTTAKNDGHSLWAMSYDLATGKSIHEIEVFNPAGPPRINPKNSFASPTGVLEPGRCYVNFGTMGTAAIDTTDGRVVWRNADLKLDHKEGPGSSLALDGERLLVTCDGMDVQYLAALDKRTGELQWRTDRTAAKNPDPDLRKAFSTPLVIETPQGRQIIGTAADRAYGYDADTGRELWYVDYEGFSNVPRPLYAEGLLLLCTGYMKPQLWAVKPDGQGNVTETHVVWQHRRGVPANSSPVVVGDAVYFVNDNGVLSCLEVKTGEERWTGRLFGNYSASPVAVGDRLYFCSEKGDCHVVQAGPEFKLLGSGKFSEPIFASPAIVHDGVILRTETQLFRLGTAGGQQPMASLQPSVLSLQPSVDGRGGSVAQP